MSRLTRLLFPLVACSLCFCGCVRHYVLTLSSGSQIDAWSKPKLKGQTYYYKDPYGKQAALPATRVHEIEPASMAREEQKAFEPAKPHKKRHWYFLWLAGRAPRRCPVDAAA